MSEEHFMHKGFPVDPDAYEWPCDICGKPFKPKLTPGGKHTPRCGPCAADMLVRMIFGQREEGDSD